MRHINYIYQNPLKLLRPTEHLYDALEHLHMNQAVLRVGDRVYREVTRAIKGLRQKLSRLERFNEPIKTKWDMLLDPFRREKVLYELGGEEALLRWEVRRKRVWVFGRQTRAAKVDVHKGSSSASRPSRIKTDATGRFYLAPAIEPLLHHRGASQGHNEGHTSQARPMPRIALTPEELRGDVLVGLGVRPERLRSEFYESERSREIQSVTHNPHPEAARSAGTRRAGIVATDPSRRRPVVCKQTSWAAPQDEVDIMPDCLRDDKNSDRDNGYHAGTD